MNTKEAWALVGGLSKPSKMPGWSIGIPAKECKTGAKLRLVKNSVCEGCYALKVVMFLKLYKKLSIKDSEPSVTLTGCWQWQHLLILKNLMCLDGMTQEMCRTCSTWRRYSKFVD